jgi:hypothetical protein
MWAGTKYVPHHTKPGLQMDFKLLSRVTKDHHMNETVGDWTNQEINSQATF